uniref:BTB domain-containing protein n=1 Tax=Panagrolaimus sp. ES5 TaxID=591445 RepID=A0AC34FXW2_9BILA
MPNGNTDAIELHIVNPYNARIQGQTGDYRQSFKNINLQLSFVIEPNALDNSEKDDVNSSLYSDKKFLQEEIFTSTDTVTDSTETGMSKKESEPSPKKESSSIQPAVKWYEIMSNNEYSDVTFISSDLNEIQSHRCLLSKYSKIFAQIIKEASELPVKINIEKFKAETIHAALDFLYDKIDAIDGKEMDVFTFALEYGIHQITDACCFFFEKSVDPTNVCEYIQIAYNQNFEELKKKCLKVLVEKKKEIDASKFAKLPENILSDFFTAL